ncbi:hypothetical protein [Methanolobus halotolerans]|uniref:Uncharacterized protein n=1 Tax=Methanolobus halotolerans TaxID=2052935 RepID=A0A4E0Q5U7_9EURY|nr:hypothetical protein [Methanolobus halotolerans]TGC09647.1 hypothetical protein CUN85_04585 [Methanolobus halotolerans]
MKTYLLLWYSSEGAMPSEVHRSLMSLGFKPIQGAYDYVYDWSDNVELDEIVHFSDKVLITLKGMSVMFKTETVNGKE